MKIILFVGLMLLSSNVVLSQGTVSLTFGRTDQPSGLLTNYQEQGFSLDPVLPITSFFVKPGFFGEFGWAEPITITRINGGSFNLDSVDWFNFSTPATIHLEARRADSSSITQLVSMVVGLQNLSAYNLTNLTALTIVGRLPTDQNGLTMDIGALNFTLVPEPAPALLLGVGAAALVCFSRFRRTKALAPTSRTSSDRWCGTACRRSSRNE